MSRFEKIRWQDGNGCVVSPVQPALRLHSLLPLTPGRQEILCVFPESGLLPGNCVYCPELLSRHLGLQDAVCQVGSSSPRHGTQVRACDHMSRRCRSRQHFQSTHATRSLRIQQTGCPYTLGRMAQHSPSGPGLSSSSLPVDSTLHIKGTTPPLGTGGPRSHSDFALVRSPDDFPQSHSFCVWAGQAPRLTSPSGPLPRLRAQPLRLTQPCLRSCLPGALSPISVNVEACSLSPCPLRTRTNHQHILGQTPSQRKFHSPG